MQYALHHLNLTMIIQIHHFIQFTAASMSKVSRWPCGAGGDWKGSILPWARFLAALVPVSNGIRLLVYGLGILKDEGLVKSVSREGDPRYLTFCHLFSTLHFLSSFSLWGAVRSSVLNCSAE